MANSSAEKVIICFDGVRREFALPFQICGSRETLAAIQRSLGRALSSGEWSYGWHDIYVHPPSGPSNTSPLSWREDGTSYDK